MAQASPHLQALSPIFRLDHPEALDLQAIEAATAKTQRGAWRYLASVFNAAAKRHCQQFSIEPDATLWRLRYRTVDGFDEQIIDDPSMLIWALEALQTQLWGDGYHNNPNRSTRFTWTHDSDDFAVTLRVVQTINGDTLQFDIEAIRPMPPLLDELGFQSAQLQALRTRLQQQHGMILITSPDATMLDDALLAINQELVSPDRKLLSVHNRHRYSMPRTMQIDLPIQTGSENTDTWKNALEAYHDTVLLHAQVPEQFHEQIANNCDQGVLALHAICVARAADSIDMLNANILRRTPLHRTVNTVVNHYPVSRLCTCCSEQAKLNNDEQQWLEQLRTPVTENVIGWLADGNTEQFMCAKGCDACADTGTAKPLAVFDIVQRDQQSNLFPSASAASDGTNGAEQTHPMQRQLMALAKSGQITLGEVKRVLLQSLNG